MTRQFTYMLAAVCAIAFLPSCHHSSDCGKCEPQQKCSNKINPPHHANLNKHDKTR